MISITTIPKINDWIWNYNYYNRYRKGQFLTKVFVSFLSFVDMLWTWSTTTKNWLKIGCCDFDGLGVGFEIEGGGILLFGLDLVNNSLLVLHHFIELFNFALSGLSHLSLLLLHFFLDLFSLFLKISLLSSVFGIKLGFEEGSFTNYTDRNQTNAYVLSASSKTTMTFSFLFFTIAIWESINLFLN